MWASANLLRLFQAITNSAFTSTWCCYKLSFDRILSEWADGNFSSHHPSAPQPIGGMLQTIMWSQQRAEAKQSELIGMTSVAEVDSSIFSRSENVKVSFEAETLSRHAKRCRHCNDMFKREVYIGVVYIE